MMKFRIFGIAGAAILALALNGCGSSSETMEEMPAPTPPAVDSAEMELSTAETALAAAEADTATTDAMLLAAQEGVEDAANALLELLEADADTAHGAVDAVRMKIATIEAAIVVTAGRIADAAAAAAATATAISDARTALTAAEAAMAALDADATNAEKLAAQKMVLAAAAAVVEAVGTGATDADTAAVTMAMAAVYSTSDRITTADSIARAMAIIVNAEDNATGKAKGGMMAPFHLDAPDVDAADVSGKDYIVAVKGTDLSVTVTDEKGSPTHDDDDVTLGAGATPADAAGWAEAGKERGSEYVAVYHNRAAPTQRPFFLVENNGGKYDPSNENDGVDLDADPTTGFDGRESYTIIGDVDGATEIGAVQTAQLKLWKAIAFEPAPTTGESASSTHTLTFSDVAATTNVDERHVEGTFDGASGAFICREASCTVTVNRKGVVTAAIGDWTFTPTVGAMVAELDGDYLQFGYWLQTTAGDDGTSSYKFQAFSDGSVPYGGDGDNVQPRMSEVGGAATYNGAAGGLYVQKRLNPDGTFDEAVDSATNGAFTADATLMANFGGANVPANKHFTISGTVTDFESDGDDDLSAWSVTLMAADFGGRDAAGALGSAHTNAFNGLTEGTAGLDHGQWRGMFYGSSADAGDLNGDGDVLDPGETDARMPSSVAGEFNAHFNNGHVHGGFGATK